MIKKFFNDRRGGVFEYIVIIAVFAVVISSTFPNFRTTVATWFGGTTSAANAGISGAKSIPASTWTTVDPSTGKTTSSFQALAERTNYYIINGSGVLTKYDDTGALKKTYTGGGSVVERGQDGYFYATTGTGIYKIDNNLNNAVTITATGSNYYGSLANGNVVMRSYLNGQTDLYLYNGSTGSLISHFLSCSGDFSNHLSCDITGFGNDKYSNIFTAFDAEDFTSQTAVTLNGGYLFNSTFDSFDGEWSIPYDIVSTNSGILYVIDTSNVLHKYVFTGYNTHTTTTTSISGLNYNSNIFTNSSGDLYVKDISNNVYKVDFTNKTIGTSKGVISGALIPDDTGGFYMVSGKTITRYDSNLVIKWTYTVSGTSSISGKNLFTNSDNQELLSVLYDNKIETINYDTGSSTSTVNLPASVTGKLYVDSYYGI